MKKPGLAIVLVGGLAAAAVALYLMFSGPRMRTQPKITPYQAILPTMPAGVIPVVAKPSGVPSPGAVAQLRNPLPDTQQTREAGAVYYGYYCAFCHGEDGRGDGPVGRSYTPVPTDLALPRVTALSDGALYRAMLTGAGHEPVLDYVIDPERRWYLVTYVRQLQAQRTDAHNVNPVKMNP
jgi:mono/diheme cytochrome c family protein